MRDICQGDIFNCFKKTIPVKGSYIVEILNNMKIYPQNDNSKDPIVFSQSTISKIRNGEQFGYMELSAKADEFYNRFFAATIKEYSLEEDQKLKDLIAFVHEQKCEFDKCDGKNDTFESYAKRMLEHGLKNIERIPPKEENTTLPDNVFKYSPPVLKSDNFYPSGNFTGRDDLLEEMKEKLDDRHAAVLCGIGGIGKTTLCERFIYEYRDVYKQAQRVRFDNMNTFKEMIAALKFVNMSEKDESANRAYEQKLELIENADSSTLIIFDNVDSEPEDMEVFEELLSKSNVRMIVTTRLSNWVDKGISIDVCALKEDEQLALFEKYYKKPLKEKEVESAKELLRFIDGHTLMITILAPIIRKNAWKIHEALEMLKTDNEISVEAGKSENDYSKYRDHITEVLKALFKMDSFTEKQLKVLYNMVLIPIDGVSYEFMLRHILSGYADEIETLSNRNWIKSNFESDNIKLQPIIRDMLIHNNMKKALSDNFFFFDKLHKAVTDFSAVIEDEDEDGEKFADNICKIANSLIALLDFDIQSDNECLAKLVDMAEFCFAHYKYIYCNNICNKVLESFKTVPQQSFEVTTLASLYMCSGRVNQRLANYEPAINSFRQALSFKTDPLERVERGKICKQIGEVYRKDSKYVDALKWIEEALKCYKEIDGGAYLSEIDLDIAEAEAINAKGVIYTNMANMAKGEYDDAKAQTLRESALASYEEALKLREQVLEKASAAYANTDDYDAKIRNIYKDLAFSHHNIGSVYYETGDLKKALSKHREGLHIREKHHLQETDIAASHTWIGKDLLELGDFAESRNELDTAMEIRKRILGEKHPDYAWSLDSLSDWYEKSGRIEDAVDTIEEVIRIRAVVLGKNHNYTEQAIKKKGRLLNLLHQ